MLRFLFSIQKNRSVFKIIFTPRLLQIFMDIGNYVRSLSHYKKIVEEFNAIREQDLKGMEVIAILQNVYNDQLQQKENSNQFRTIRSYILLELIGSVFSFILIFYITIPQAKEHLDLFTYVRKAKINTLSKLFLQKYQKKEVLIIIKLFSDAHQQFNDDHQYLDNFKEVSIQKELHHPNIVKYYESFMEQHNLCIVMEFIGGYILSQIIYKFMFRFNLSELIKLQNEKGASFPESIIWKILINLCSVLKYLHIDKKIVHRDLNPANIMIDSSFQIKICDFGLAKTLSQTVPNNSFVGTLIYTCPEIVENKSYSEKADIWAVGCIVYELAKLKPPFVSNNALTLAKKIVEVEYEKLDKNNCEYSEELILFVENCLSYQQEKRPNILQLIQSISVKLVEQMDQIKENQIELNEEIISLTKKSNNQTNIVIVYKEKIL